MKEEFEWDNKKAAANLKRHGMAFADIIGVFCDNFAIESPDIREDYGESRWNRIAMCRGVVIHVTYCERGSRIRIISARRAETFEHEIYYRENRL